jgi:hypothetical protein
LSLEYGVSMYEFQAHNFYAKVGTKENAQTGRGDGISKGPWPHSDDIEVSMSCEVFSLDVVKSQRKSPKKG